MDATHRSLSRTLLTLAKFALAAGILGYLLYQAQANQSIAELRDQPKNWWLLSVALVCEFFSIALSFIRWRLLVVAVGIDFPTTEALRLGALGYALNFVSLGNLGGDLFKAIFLAHKRPGHRTEAVASVIIDRLLGLSMMLVLASIGILATGMLFDSNDALRALCQLILASTLAGVVFVLLLFLVPSLTGERMTERVRSLPVVGNIAERLLIAVRTYRTQTRLVIQAAAIGFVVDLLYIVSFFLVASSLFPRVPTLFQHMLIVPVASLAGAIPLTPAGLGTLEATTEVLYRAMPGIADNIGTLATLAHRLTTIAVAVIGVIYYFAYRSEVREVLAEAEDLKEL